MSAHLDEKKDVYTQDHLEYSAKPDNNVISDNYGQYIADAADSSAQQKNQTIREALFMYKKGIMFSLIFSTAIIMEVGFTSRSEEPETDSRRDTTPCS
jgi:hypothetical protein